jgi:hypothetical protein
MKEVTAVRDGNDVLHLKGEGSSGLCGVGLPDDARPYKLAERHYHDHRAACMECRQRLARAVLDLLLCGRLDDTPIGEARRYTVVEGKLYRAFRE